MTSRTTFVDSLPHTLIHVNPYNVAAKSHPQIPPVVRFTLVPAKTPSTKDRSRLSALRTPG